MRMRGAALILVLWLTALLAALIGAFAMTAQIEYLQTRTLGSGLVAAQAARAGLEYAATRVSDPDPLRQWLPDGRAYPWRFADAEVEVRIVDESGKLDLNAADVAALAALMRAVGVEPDAADAVAAAIVDWRDPDDLTQPQGGAEDPQYAAAGLPWGAKDAPFETVAEVEQVLGMTPDIYARLAGHLTIHSGLPIPDPRFATAAVLASMGIDAEQVLANRERPPQPGDPSFVGAGSGTYSIDSRARLRDGRESVLRAVVRLGPSGVPGSAFTVMRWEEGASPR
ncbi:general secretion pathway protein GspK [Luteimonas saliphila]|uniref:general secretion pathway protein GspK n=1 Tax=Luteimonas saliphila TaxID=2804919 RepID=UPI00192D6086|nr:type II secretion system protein GspK [Luteimonas saliphila]